MQRPYCGLIVSRAAIHIVSSRPPCRRDEEEEGDGAPRDRRGGAGEAEAVTLLSRCVRHAYQLCTWRERCYIYIHDVYLYASC